MKFGSVCSGIEAASVAWEPIGWRAAWFSEIEPLPCSVLAHHWPKTPNHGDMTKFKEWKRDPIDLLVGGTPCQSFSIAGLRKGLDDPRGNLMLTFGAIAAEYRPRWLVWENVPGVLSSNSGQDFGSFLGMLGEIGYGFAYRVIDAQFFGVAQRRRRVFVVGYLGDWRVAAAVLFERHSLSGHPAPCREEGQAAAGTLDARTKSGGFPGTDGACARHIQPVLYAGNQQSQVAATLQTTCDDYSRADGFNAIVQPLPFETTQITSTANRSQPKHGDPCHPIAAAAHPPAVAIHGTQDPSIQREMAHTLGRNSGQENAVCVTAFTCKDYGADAGAISPTLRAMGHAGSHPNAGGQVAIQDRLMRVRRLTPTECERLQGFPDNHTLVPHRGKPAADGPRYKAIGNSMAVPVMRWIGVRINSVSQLKESA